SLARWTFGARLGRRGSGDYRLHQERNRGTEVGARRERESALADHGARARASACGRSSAERTGVGRHCCTAVESGGVVDCLSVACGAGSRLRLSSAQTRVGSADLWPAATGGRLSRRWLSLADSGIIASAVVARRAA